MPLTSFTEHSQKNLKGASEPRSIAFDRKYKGCSEMMKTDESCGNESWAVDLTIPSEMFPSGLSRICLRYPDDVDGGDDRNQVLFW